MIKCRGVQFIQSNCLDLRSSLNMAKLTLQRGGKAFPSLIVNSDFTSLRSLVTLSSRPTVQPYFHLNSQSVIQRSSHALSSFSASSHKRISPLYPHTMPSFHKHLLQNQFRHFHALSLSRQLPDLEFSCKTPSEWGTDKHSRAKDPQLLLSHVLPLNLQKQALHQTNKLNKKGPSIKSAFKSPKDFVDSMPTDVQPYLRLARLDRPIGSWLLWLPCSWSISLAAAPGHLPSLYMLGLFGVGAVLMRGAGCTINDMWDKDFDAKVARTKDRPLASGLLKLKEAVPFLGVQLAAALVILLSFNWYTILLGASSMALVVTYPLMKRYIEWPQAFLGLTLNWGALVGYSAIQGYCDWGVVLPLYAACFSWTMVYDTIYGHQDKKYDAKIGVKSSSLSFSDDTKTWLTGFSAAMVTCLAYAGVASDQTFPFYLGLAGVAAHLAHQVRTVDLDNPEDCGRKFRSNRDLGLILLAAIIASNLLRRNKDRAKGKTTTTVTTTTTSA